MCNKREKQEGLKVPVWPWMSLSPSLSYRFPKPPSKKVKLINSKLSSGFGVCDVSSAVYDLRAAIRREETDVSLQMGASGLLWVSVTGIQFTGA